VAKVDVDDIRATTGHLPDILSHADRRDELRDDGEP
jgi:hypothetical protein